MKNFLFLLLSLVFISCTYKTSLPSGMLLAESRPSIFKQKEFFNTIARCNPRQVARHLDFYSQTVYRVKTLGIEKDLECHLLLHLYGQKKVKQLCKIKQEHLLIAYKIAKFDIKNIANQKRRKILQLLIDNFFNSIKSSCNHITSPNYM